MRRLRERIDSPEGRARYGRRFATVEPVFANLRHNKQLNRFTLRGRIKVDAQWKLY
ncbi:MAG: transposase, partial [Burkholderiales bacterium]